MNEPRDDMSGYIASLVGLAILILIAAIDVAVLIIKTSGEEQIPVVAMTPTPGAASTSPGAGPELQIRMIPTIRFDTEQLRVGQGEVTVRADNSDDSISHNWALYPSRQDAESGSKPIAATKICSAPCTDKVTFSALPGQYFFHCEVHPQQMTGTFIVE